MVSLLLFSILLAIHPISSHTSENFPREILREIEHTERDKHRSNNFFDKSAVVAITIAVARQH